MYKRAFFIGLAVILLFSAASAQRAEVTVGLNEAFFDALLDSAFQNFEPPVFSILDDVPSMPPSRFKKSVALPIETFADRRRR